MNKIKKRKSDSLAKVIYVGVLVLLVVAAFWPKPERHEELQPEVEVTETDDEPASVELEEPVVAEIEKQEETEPAAVTTTMSYPANRMTHYVMDGNDAGTCIAGRWCIGNQLTVADDTSVRYQGYYVYAVHCSVVKEWRGSIIKVYYTDGGVETGIVLDCGGFAGHKDRMDKAMGRRYNGNRDNYTFSRYIEKTEVIRKGW